MSQPETRSNRTQTGLLAPKRTSQPETRSNRTLPGPNWTLIIGRMVSKKKPMPTTKIQSVQGQWRVQMLVSHGENGPDSLSKEVGHGEWSNLCSIFPIPKHLWGGFALKFLVFAEYILNTLLKYSLPWNCFTASCLVTWPKQTPLSRDRCSNTPVALCFLWYRRLSLRHPHFFSKKIAYRRGLTRGVSQKRLPRKPIAQKGASHEIVSPIAL